MNAETLRDAAALAALAPEWWALWRRTPEATPFQSPAWLLPWWHAFAPGELCVVAVRCDGRLAGLAPCYVEAGTRRLLPLGIALGDYCDVLLEPDHRPGAGAAMAAHLAADAGWVEWRLPDLAPTAAAWHLPVPDGCRETIDAATPCAVLGLPAAIPKRQRRKHRMALHRAARRGGARIAPAAGDAVSRLTGELCRLHGLRWASRGVPGGVFADRRVVMFFEAAAPALHAAGLLRLYTVEIGGTLAGVYWGFLHCDRAYAYLGGFDPAFSFESPGTLLIAHAIAEATSEGVGELDFLRGGEAYKFDWGCSRRDSRCRSFARQAADVAV